MSFSNSVATINTVSIFAGIEKTPIPAVPAVAGAVARRGDCCFSGRNPRASVRISSARLGCSTYFCGLA